MKLTRKMILSVLTLILTVVALGTTTYAWFTVGDTVAVNEFNMEVQSGIGLEVAWGYDKTNNNGFVKNLTEEELYENLVKAYFDPEDYQVYNEISEEDEDPSDWGAAWAALFAMDAFTSTDGVVLNSLNEDGTINSSTASKEDGFIEFNLVFRTKEVGSPTVVWDKVNLVSTGIVGWKPEKDYTPVASPFNGETGVAKTASGTHYAANATRISVAEYSSSTTVVYELGSTWTNASSVTVNNTILNEDGYEWEKGAHDYFKQVTSINLQTANSSIAKRAKTSETDISTGEKVATFGIVDDGYRYAAITVRIYIEGFDAEAFNAILSDTIKVALGFSLGN